MPSRASDTAGHGPSSEFGWRPTYHCARAAVIAAAFFHCTVTRACAALVPALYNQLNIRSRLRGWLHPAARNAASSR